MNFPKRVFSIFIALFICVCVVFPVLRANGFFKSKERLVENEKTPSEDQEKESSQEQIKARHDKSVKMDDKKSPENSISIPKVVVIEKQKKIPPEIKSQLPLELEGEKNAIISGDLPSVEKAEALNNTIIHAPVKALNVQSEVQQREQDDNGNPTTATNPQFNSDLVKYENAASVVKKASTSGGQEDVEVEQRFDFEEYSKNLVKIAGLKDGENIPLLVFDEQNYKEGLSFYGYQLVAIPKPWPKKPYYFFYNESQIRLVKEKPPYSGSFPPATEEDIMLFQRLLSKSVYSEMANNTQFQGFYAPMDLRMEKLFRCKIKSILDSFHEKLNEVVKVHCNFKRIGKAYILIIDSFMRANGEVVRVNDPDNDKA